MSARSDRERRRRAADRIEQWLGELREQGHGKDEAERLLAEWMLTNDEVRWYLIHRESIAIADAQIAERVERGELEAVVKPDGRVFYGGRRERATTNVAPAAAPTSAHDPSRSRGGAES
jgi:hypothetical protein